MDGNHEEALTELSFRLQGMVVPYEAQSFSALRRQCRENGRLFEDPLFPTSDQSLFYQNNRIGTVTWKRPKVRTQPRFVKMFQPGNVIRDVMSSSQESMTNDHQY